jgi:hypothetical protein
MKTKHVLIGLGILAVGITAVVLIKKSKEEPKGEGSVDEKSKKENKIVITRTNK